MSGNNQGKKKTGNRDSSTLESITTGSERAEQKIKQLNSLLKSIRDVNQYINQEDDIDKLTRSVCRRLHKTRNYQNIEIAMLDPASDMIKPVGNAGIHSLRDWLVSPKAKGNAPKCIKKCLRTRKTLIVENTDTFCAGCPYFHEDSKYEGIFVPMMQKDELVGVLSVALRPGHKMVDEEINFLEVVGSELGFVRKKYQSELALSEIEAQFQQFFDNNPDYCYFISPDRIILNINKSALRILGYKKNEIIGKPLETIYAPESHKRMKYLFNRWKKTGKLTNEEMVILTKSGERRTVLLSADHVIRGGRLNHSISIQRDITKRKLAEDYLQKSEDQYRVLVEQSLLGIGISKGSQVVFANAALLRIFGYDTLEEFKKVPLMDHVAPSSREQISNHIRSAPNEDLTRNDFEYNIIRKDGQIRTLHARTTYFQDGEEVYTQTTFEDITARKSAEESLKATKDELQRTLEATTDGIWTWNFTTNELFFSPRYYRMLGYLPDEFPANYENWIDLIHPDDRAKALSVAEKYLKTKPDSYENVFRLRTKNGDYRWIHARGRVVEKNKNGEAVLMIGNHEDITERKQTEEALRESEENYRALFENAGDAIFIADADSGIILDVNKMAEKLLDMPRNEIIGKNQSSVHPKSSIYTKQFDTHVRSGHMVDDESMVIDRNGRLIPVRISATVMELGGRRIIKGIFRDITERKKAEAALQESENRFHQLFENMSSGVAVYEAIENGKDFIFKDFNKAAEKIDHMEKKNLIGKRITEVFPNVTEFGLFKVLYSVWQTGRPQHHPISLYKDKRITGWRENYIYKLPSGEIIAIYDDITERRKAEVLLQESENRFRTITESSADAIFITDSSTRYVYVNKKATRLLGYSSKELLNMKISDISLPEDNRSSIELFEKLTRKENLTAEIRLVRKDGRIIPADLNAVILPNGLFYGSCRDITERKRAEKALLESRSQFNLAQRAASIGYWRLQISDKTFQWSDEVFRIFGLNPQNPPPVYHDFWKYIHPDDRKEVKIYAEKQLTPLTRMMRYTYRIITKEGVMKYLEQIGMQELDAKGNVAVIYGTIQDVTERQLAEEELRQSEKRYRTLFENMVQGAFYQQADGKIVDANSASLEMFGLTRDEFLGRTSMDPHWNVIHENGSDFPGQEHPSMKALRTGKPVNDVIAGVYNPVKKNYVWLNINATPQFRPGENRPYQVFVTLHDITDRKQAQMAVEQSLREKEILIKELYHRTKNNMQVISSLLRLKARSIDNEELSDAFKEVENKILSMALVHKELYQSRDLSHLNLKHYIQNLVSLIKQSYSGFLDQITIKLHLKDITVLIDTAIPVGLAVNELVTNAIKYAFPDKKNGNIEIRLYQLPLKNMAIEVNDNGVGLPKNFDLKKDIHLGLQTVYDLVEGQLKGKVKFIKRKGLHCRLTFGQNLYEPRV